MPETSFHSPIMDGINLMRHVRKNSDNRFLPNPMPTSENSQERHEEVKTAESSARIVKPFKPTQLSPELLADHWTTSTRNIHHNRRIS